eukprot:m51a1_g2036 hypothetical protein (356) ;mRNA; f:1339168-1340916
MEARIAAGTAVFVSNISPSAQEKTVTDFFSFCGEIKELTLRSTADGGKEAIVAFETEAAAKTAMLLNNAIIVDRPIAIRPLTAADVSAPTGATETRVAGSEIEQKQFGGVPDSQRSATSVVASMIASGYVLGEDMRKKALEYDEKLRITEQIRQSAEAVKAKAAEIDSTMHITSTFSAGMSWLASTVTSVDQTLGITSTIKNVDQTLGISTRASAMSEQIIEGAANAAGVVRSAVTVAAVTAADAPVIRDGVTAVRSAGERITSTATQLRQETSAAIDAKHGSTASSSPLAAPAPASDLITEHVQLNDAPAAAPAPAPVPVPVAAPAPAVAPAPVAAPAPAPAPAAGAAPAPARQ